MILHTQGWERALMNGLSLVIALAAVGVNVEWEAGPGGQLYYTIHLESRYLKPLRDGQAVVTEVEAADRRNLRRIQIIIDQTNTRGAVIAGGDSAVKYGWRPSRDENGNSSGGLDYMVQLSPERLESLARGAKLAAEIPAEVRDIRTIYIFAGTQDLPQELLPEASNTSGQGQRTPGMAEQASAQLADATSRSRNESVSLGGAQPSSDGARGAFASDRGVATSGQFSDDSRWQSGQPASSSSADSRRGDLSSNRTTPLDQSFTGSDRRDDARRSRAEAGGYASPRADDRSRNLDRSGYGRNGLDETGFPNDRDPRNGFERRQPDPDDYQRRDPRGYDPREYEARNYDSRDYSGREYRRGFERDNQTASERWAQKQTVDDRGNTLGPRNPVVPASGTSHATFPQPAATGSLAAPVAQGNVPQGFAPTQINPNLAAAAVPTTLGPADTSDEKLRPWTPLILTTLSLFASLGANAYLGWLAWSFFWRYRDAASDVARARYSSVSNRQAA